jgi:AbrB family looped-hinge helix DNA binding protein
VKPGGVFADSLLRGKNYENTKRGNNMELAKITSNGQVAIPANLLRALNLRDGDDVAFLEKDGQYIIFNPKSNASEDLQNTLQKTAELHGLKSVDDVISLIKEVRSDKRGPK